MKLIGILILALSFTKCASVKMENNHPFKIESASYSHVTGGVKGSYNSTNLIINFTAEKPVDFQKVYFQNRITKAIVEQHNDKQYITARYKTSSNELNDLILHADPKKEFGNTPAEEFPFELKENEAMVSYIIEEKTHYVKIENIIKKDKVFMQ
ncbi:hypothetical protein SAMN05444344_1256 [Tenacibaculum mesophilum]|uniref:Lipoprotein n=1 Tax=Tenacibaculum mesophilum TaxID=104268 RepID=A0ABM7CGR6_9FLAO|nr:hypothetical protein [Tenacibaculum mesophilum]AZJ32982.1 hypothetical protein D6200_10615 [Tenacibaculum mesophilum]QFS28232.1 hypothetical protein F9Y86_07440 [Tenacibaculum mesophilum]SHF69863.1 hypothetical protein SAMN05444344_1256 [Tenacibaculum mesophilum]